MYTKIANNVKDFLTDRKEEVICWMVSQVCRSQKKRFQGGIHLPDITSSKRRLKSQSPDPPDDASE